MEKQRIKAYKKGCGYSYMPGAFGTIEMLRAAPEIVRRVYVHSDYRESDALFALCREREVPFEQNDAVFRRVNLKENALVLGVFTPSTGVLAADKPHVMLVNPSDFGNLGTVIRTLAGLNLFDLALIPPAADIFHPKTVRATMGALFRIRHAEFADIEAYRRQFPSHRCFPFMLDGAVPLESAEAPESGLFTLIFGNEATGLPLDFSAIGQPVKIPQSDCVDSLNLSVAVGIGAYAFARNTGLVNA